ncbi:MAG: efflux RND transporter periplasmic adaptor subunit [Steroidobacteraceae bacterium]|jgi:RND family efflux transporter MFP subunit|nr:efflux RND transporter periplasmic adaptor subunit [Steroidobacteraceae bacterium]
MNLDTRSLESLRIDRGAAADRYRDPPRRRRLVVGVAAGLGVAAVAAYLLLRGSGTEVDTVAVSSPGAAGAAAVLNASGYVVARRVATVSSKVTGRIAEVLVEEGARVEKDQLLARLDATTGEAEAELARRQLEATLGNLAEVEARLAESRRTLQRTTALRERGLVAEGALDAARAETQALEARLAAARAQRRVAESGVRLRERDLADHQIRAPFAGVVISKDAQPGEMVSPMSAGGGFTRTGIATIVDMDSREIEVDVNEAFLNRVSDGQPVEAVLDAYPEWRIPARVINIVPTADRTKASVRVRIGFESLDPRILPDMGIKVRFLEPPGAGIGASTKPPLPRVPAAALERLPGGAAVAWVVVEGRARRRELRAGGERDGLVEVVSGLAPGEVVVSPRVEGLRDGARVVRREP